MFDPALLRTFLAVAETRGFTEAARRLEIGQSTVSQHVRKLETAAGRELLLRDTHSVELTSDGQAMIGFARNILDQHDRAKRYFDRPEPRGLVRLGVCEDLARGGLPEILRRFRRHYPLIEVDVTVELSVLLRQRLAANELDLVLAKRPADVDGPPLWRDELVWVGAPDMRVPPDEPIPLVVYPRPSITRHHALETLQRHGHEWRIGCTSSHLSGLRAAALAGLGVALFARTFVPDGLVPVGTSLPAAGNVTFTLTSRNSIMDGPAAALADVITTSRWRHPR